MVGIAPFNASCGIFFLRTREIIACNLFYRDIIGPDHHFDLEHRQMPVYIKCDYLDQTLGILQINDKFRDRLVRALKFQINIVTVSGNAIICILFVAGIHFMTLKVGQLILIRQG